MAIERIIFVCVPTSNMDGPIFTINGDSLDFTLNTKTKQWHIKRNLHDTIMVLSKVKGDTVIKFLEILQRDE